MVEETIRTIKDTECEADKAMKEADAACAEILEKADANLLYHGKIVTTEAKAKENAQFAMNEAKKAGEEAVKDALQKVDEEIVSLKREAGSKEAEAIAAVIAQLV